MIPDKKVDHPQDQVNENLMSNIPHLSKNSHIKFTKFKSSRS